MSFLEEEDTRTQWLATLKVGEQVALPQEGLGPKYYLICVVKYITPTRKRIDVTTPNAGVISFGEDGWTRRTRGDHWSNRQRIVPVTKEILASIKRRRVQSKLERAIMTDRSRVREDLSLDQMERILAILGESNAAPPKDA